jgi:glutamate/tyrosine decarboxylase-like PLP-dependent enzyme
MDALREAVRADADAGLRPFCVISNAGTVGTGAVDPLIEIAAFCREQGLWHHADAAYGGGAVICERGKRALKGLELADSMALDPHKWLFQPFDIGCVLVRDEQELVDVFRIIPAYMNDVYRMEADINFCDRGLELTRPFRALKLWMSLQHFGLAAFRSAVQRGFELAEAAEAILRANPRWELLTPAQMAIVTFRHQGDDALQTRLVDEITASGHALLTSTTVAGRAAIRLCTINPRATGEDIQSTIDKLSSIASTQ